MTIEEIEKVYSLHEKIIRKYLSKDRADKVIAMIEDLGDIYVTSPASTKNWYHGAYPGGYLNHVNTVVRYALLQMKNYKELGGTIDFTEEELVFAALFHDLGKIGLKDQPNYLPQDSEWHQKNRGEIYKNNTELDFMLIPDRSLFILQQYGIQITQKEYLAIKLHDGLFEETNKPYYISFNPDTRLRSNIVAILHTADFLASRLEFDLEKQQ